MVNLLLLAASIRPRRVLDVNKAGRLRDTPVSWFAVYDASALGITWTDAKEDEGSAG
jgi:hypothetical protein